MNVVSLYCALLVGFIVFCLIALFAMVDMMVIWFVSDSVVLLFVLNLLELMRAIVVWRMFWDLRLVLNGCLLLFGICIGFAAYV